MATEVTRNQVGMTDKGQVVVIEKTSADGTTFDVRHGVRTIGPFATVEEANAVAFAVAGVPLPVVEPAPEPEGKVVVVSKGKK